MRKELDFAGQGVVITGGGEGIGRACAEALVDLGAAVLIAGRTEATLRATADCLIARGGACDYVVADVTMEDQIDALCGVARRKWGGVKALINNAGNTHRASVDTLASEDWRRLMALNLDSVFLMSRAFMPLLLAADKPSILNVASTFSVIGYPTMPAYSAAKGGVVSLTRQMAVDYGPRGLRVNAISPGPTLSPRILGYMKAGHTDRGRVESMVPLRRWAECSEIGNVAAFLVSDAASYITGANIVVDGGQTIQ